MTIGHVTFTTSTGGGPQNGAAVQKKEPYIRSLVNRQDIILSEMNSITQRLAALVERIHGPNPPGEGQAEGPAPTGGHSLAVDTRLDSMSKQLDMQRALLGRIEDFV